MTDDSLIGRQLANFRIEKAIGRGGMAEVYYGQDVKLERPVAIKVIDVRHRGDPAYAERFVNEAKAVATWRHEHVVQIYYADDEDGLYYFVMEYIDGQDLSKLIAHYREQGEYVPHQEVIRVGHAIAAALDYAHEKGIIHRDVKPSNVMVAQDGRVVLTDFGLALDVEQGSLGEVFGSSYYVAPEQARRSADAVPQSDLYSLGIILYEMLTGRVPFDDPSPTAVALQHVTAEPPPPRELNPNLSQETEAVLLKALNKSPEERYQSGQGLIEALQEALQVEEIGDEPPPVTVLSGPIAAEEESPDSLIGKQLDEYRLEAVLGRGGMARVYRGLDVRLNRRVAIKVIDTPFQTDPEYIKRFEREAQAIAQLEHPHIVRLYRYGEAHGLLYIAMQYIAGRSLNAVLAAHRQEEEQLSPADIRRITREICLALDYAHDKGVIHRDVKPSNIMLDEEGAVFLTDFGLALLTEVGTRGEILGSPHYIAPEQAISSAKVVPQSDLYSVGVILYELFTGVVPFDAAEPLDTAMLHVSEPPPPPREVQPDLSPELEAMLLKCLAKSPEERYPDGEALANALEETLPPAPEEVAPPVEEAEPSPPVAVVASQQTELKPGETPPEPEPAPEEKQEPEPAAKEETKPPEKEKVEEEEAESKPALPPVPAAVAAQTGQEAKEEPPSLVSAMTPANAPARVISRTMRDPDKRPIAYILLGGVALILIIILALFFLFWRGGERTESAQEAVLPAQESSTVTVTATATPEATAGQPVASEADTPTPAMNAPTPSLTPLPSPTETLPPSSTAMPSPEATATAIATTPAPTSTPAAAAIAPSPTASPSPTRTASPTPTPTPTPPIYRLAFTRWDGGKHTIWLVDTDGQNLQYLRDFGASPAWSPNGQFIAFRGEEGLSGQVGFGSGGIWRMNAFGGGLTQLKEDGNARMVAWGSIIAYDSIRGSDYRVYFVNSAGQEQAGAIPGEQPAWSPDGGWLVMRACRPNCGLWVVDRNDTAPRQLTWGASDGLPAWSPDGEKIAFSRGNITDIYVVNADGSEEVERLTEASGHDILPTWTPDSRQIAFRSARNGRWQIFIMNADGSDQQMIVDNAAVSDDWPLNHISVTELN